MREGPGKKNRARKRRDGCGGQLVVLVQQSCTDRELKGTIQKVKQVDQFSAKSLDGLVKTES